MVGSPGAGRRRDRFQRRQELVGIILDRRNAVAREQFRKQPQHDLAVLQHVGDAGRRARIVLEHVEGLGVDPHDVDAGDMDVDVVRHFLAVHLRAENRILEDQVFGDDVGFENFAAAIDVLDIGVDGLHALLEAAPHDLPFLGGDDARDDVERDQALLRLGVAIDRKGDADAAEQELRLAPAVVEHVGRDLAEPVLQLGIGRPHRAGAVLHFVEHDPARSSLHGQRPKAHQFKPLWPIPRVHSSNLRAKLFRRRDGLGLCRPPIIAHELGVVTIAAASLEPPSLPR